MGMFDKLSGILGSTHEEEKIEKRGVERPPVDIRELVTPAGIKFPAYARDYADLFWISKQSVILRTCHLNIRDEVFRRGAEFKPKFKSKCPQCNVEYEKEVEICPNEKCNGQKTIAPSDTQRRYGEIWAECCNLNGQSLEQVIRECEDDINCVDDGYLLMIPDYYMCDIEGNIIYRSLKEIVRGNPVVMRLIADQTGKPGGWKYTCAMHREEVYEEKNRKCKKCGRKTHNVHFVAVSGETPIKFYIKGEVIHWSAYSPSMFYGYPPTLTVWMMTTTLMAMTTYVYDTYEHRRLPNKLIFIYTDNETALRKSIKTWKDEVKKDIGFSAVIPIKQPLTATQRLNPVEVVELIDSLKEMEFIPARDEMRQRISALFGVSNIFMADVSTSGGLNNEGLQILVTNRTVQGRQRIYNIQVYPPILKALYITDWIRELLPSEEEDEMSELQRDEKKVEIAAKYLEMGFDVEMDESTGEFKISGKASRPTQYPGLFNGSPLVGTMPNQYPSSSRQTEGQTGDTGGEITAKPCPPGQHRHDEHKRCHDQILDHEEKSMTKSQLVKGLLEWYGEDDEILKMANISQYPINYIGNKRKFLDFFDKLIPKGTDIVCDAMAGSGVVAYALKLDGYKVIANDILDFPTRINKALIENDDITLSDADIDFILKTPTKSSYIEETFKDLYTRNIRKDMDQLFENIQKLRGYKQDIALASLGATCTAVVEFQRANNPKDGAAFKESFIRKVTQFNRLIEQAKEVSTQKCTVFQKDVFELLPEIRADLVYLDPPYVRKGMQGYEVASYKEQGGSILFAEHLMSGFKKTEKKVNRFISKDVKEAGTLFGELFSKMKHIPLVLMSYNNKSVPEKDEMKQLALKSGFEGELHKIPHTYTSMYTGPKSTGEEERKVEEYVYVLKKASHNIQKASFTDSRTISAKFRNALETAYHDEFDHLLKLDRKIPMSTLMSTVNEVMRKTLRRMKSITSDYMKEMYDYGIQTIGNKLGVDLFFDRIDEEALNQISEHSVLWKSYANMDESLSGKLNEIVKESYADPRGFTIDEMVEKMREEVNLEEYRIKRIARNESHVAAVAGRTRGYEKADPEGKYVFEWNGPDDARTTDLCNDIKAEIKKRGGAVPLNELEEIVKYYAKKYDPKWIDRGVMSPHINCRHGPLRVVKFDEPKNWNYDLIVSEGIHNPYHLKVFYKGRQIYDNKFVKKEEAMTELERQKEYIKRMEKAGLQP